MYISKKIIKSYLLKFAKQHKIKISKKKASQQGFYFLQLKADIDKLLGNKAKKYVSCYFQLKFKYNVINMFLIKIKVTKTLESQLCKKIKQFVKYLYIKC